MKNFKQNGFGIVPVLLIALLVGAIGFIGYGVYQNQNNEIVTPIDTIGSFDECVAAGNPIMESYPEQCAANGQTFTRIIEATSSDDSEPPTGIAFSDVSEELQNTILTVYSTEAPECQNSDSMKDRYYDRDKIVQQYKANRAAVVGVGCGGSAAHLFVYTSGLWKDVQSTQMGFGCDTIDKYKVPSTVVRGCLTDDGKDRVVSYE